MASGEPPSSPGGYRDVPPEVRAFVREQMRSYGTEELLYEQWIAKSKHGRVQDRLLAITTFHLFTIKSGRTGRSVQRRAHLYQLSKCRCSPLDADQLDGEWSVHLECGEWALSFETSKNRAREIVYLLWDLTGSISPGFPASARCAFVGLLESTTLASARPPPVLSPQDSFCAVFRAYASYYGIEKPAVIETTLRADLARGSKLLNLNDLAAGVRDQQRALLFGVCMSSLEYDTWFTAFSVADWPLGDDALRLAYMTINSNHCLRLLRLRGVGGTRAGAESLRPALAANVSLAELDLGRNAMGDRGLLEVAAGLIRHPLRSLCVDGFGAEPQACALFVEKLTQSNETAAALRSLDLSGNKLGSRACRLLFRWLMSDRCRLTRLAVARCPGSDLDAILLALKGRSHRPRVEQLDLSGNSVSGVVGGLLIELLVAQPDLCHLNLSGCKTSPDVAEAVVAAMLKTQARVRLVLGRRDGGGGDGDGDAPPPPPPLQPRGAGPEERAGGRAGGSSSGDSSPSLSLTPRSGHSGLFGAAAADDDEEEEATCPGVAEWVSEEVPVSHRPGPVVGVRLDLSGVELPPETAVRVASLVSGSEVLEELRLADCRMGLAGTSWMAAALVGLPALRSVVLDRNVSRTESGASGGSEAGDPDLTVQITNLVRKTPSLRRLSLAGDAEQGLATDLVNVLLGMRFLRASPLLSLDVSGNALGTPGALALAQALEHAPFLRTLRFDGNHLSVSDAAAVAAAVRLHPALTVCPSPERDLARALGRVPSSGGGAGSGSGAGGGGAGTAQVQSQAESVRRTLFDACRKNILTARSAPAAPVSVPVVAGVRSPSPTPPPPPPRAH